MATFPQFTEGEYAQKDANSTISVDHFVAGYNGTAVAGAERRYSIRNLKSLINRDIVVAGAGPDNNSQEGGQISLCGSEKTGSNWTAMWNVDVFEPNAVGREEELRIFTPGGNTLFEFQRNGKCRLGGDSFTNSATGYRTETVLIYDRATSQLGNSQWQCTNPNGNPQIYRWTGNFANYPVVNVGDVVCIGISQHGEAKDRLGWRTITAVDNDTRQITCGAVVLPANNNQVRMFKEDPGLAVMGRDTDASSRIIFKSGPNRTTRAIRMKVGEIDTEAAFALDVTGDIRASGNIIAQSDGRYKENTTTIDNGLDKVKQLRGVSYIKKNSKRNDLGLVAQEIEAVLPELVTTHIGAEFVDEKSVNYNGVIPVLVEAIKEQQKQIEELQQRIS